MGSRASHRQDGRDDVTMKVVVIVLSMSVIATAFTIDDPRLPLRRQRRHPGLFSELLDYGLLDIFQDPNEVYSGTTQEPQDSLAIQARTKREPGLLDGLLDIFKDPSDSSSSSYSAPTSYKEPESTYKEPEPSYKEPEEPILAINIGVGNEAIIARSKREPGLLDGILDIFKDPSDTSYEVPQATSYEVPQATSYEEVPQAT